MRLLDPSGKQIGIVDTSEAIRQARELNLDLVEIAPKAQPPVAKITDFKKLKYEESKKERSAKKKTRQIETKEIWLGPLMSEHDLKVRVGHAQEFLKLGDRVKLTVKFGGREIVHPEYGFKTLERAVDMLVETGEKDSEPRLVGRNLSLSMKPTKGKIHEKEDKENS